MSSPVKIQERLPALVIITESLAVTIRDVEESACMGILLLCVAYLCKQLTGRAVYCVATIYGARPPSPLGPPVFPVLSVLGGHGHWAGTGGGEDIEDTQRQ